MGLDDEIYRAMKNKFNHVEPTVIGTVIGTNGITVTVHVPSQEMEPYQDVPVVKPPFEGVGDMNLVNGDQVLLAFIQGYLNGPIVIGRV